MSGRRSGVLLPLFACRSSASWGIGDIGDIEPLTSWLSAAGQRTLQLLPINEMAPGQQSPYSAISALAIDPLYIALPRVAEFQTLGGISALSADDRTRLVEAQRSPRVAYDLVRAVKDRALRSAFDRFVTVEWDRATERADALRRYIADQAWWLDDYALFRAVHADFNECAWTDWPAALRDREGAAITHARETLWRDILYRQYLQWLADIQWQTARASTHGVALFGDLPFMVDGDSADVWAHQDQFRLDVSVGVPPDAFSDSGQDWGMPPYRWEAHAASDFAWLRARARRGAALFDGYRVDHLVGFYRTYGRPRDGGEPFFSPSAEHDQTALGEWVLSILREPGAEVIAEDLGTVPDFVRESLARLAVPGYRVFRWERHWDLAGQPFRDPAEYPAVSVATSGTHDTEPMATWWDEAPATDRQQIETIPAVRQLAPEGSLVARPFDGHVRDVLLEALFASGSDLLLLPMGDVFGWTDRINEPATVTDGNWTFVLPWPVDHWADIDEARERQSTLATWAARHGR